MDEKQTESLKATVFFSLLTNMKSERAREREREREREALFVLRTFKYISRCIYLHTGNICLYR